ncbi:nucleolar protein 6-like isoform X2 [Mya arenaria]|uniref:nucleolar protein 6-like isoform X2 n=1 Tax=Mya arenaria TaxID=6604 RepID=UPI0022E790BC|nr:nucleolar protein 6-like isoform X2 [Mya arenaria]
MSSEEEMSDSGEDSDVSATVEDSDVDNSEAEMDSVGEEEEEEEQAEITTGKIEHDSRKRFLEPSIDLPEGVPASKVSRNNKGDLYRPPTNEELNELKETENLFHSTLFRLQITELLAEVIMKEKRRKRIEEAVEFLKTALLNLKPGKKYELTDRKLLTKLGVPVPMEMEPESDKGRFQFQPPSSVNVTGSFSAKICAKPAVSVDLVLSMPKECFDGMDHLNQRYLRKRAIYLAIVAKALRQKPEVTDVKVSYHNGNSIKPKLVVDVKVGDHRPVTVHLYAVPETGTFKLSRFQLEKNNVRASWWEGQDGTDASELPTPFYNTSILEDISMTTEVPGLEKISGSQGLREGIILLKVWLSQRGLNKGYGSFSNHVMMMYVLYLLNQRKLNTLMSSYQVFRNTLLKFSESSWTDTGISLCTGSQDSNSPLVVDFHRHFDVVFVDHSGYLNLAYTMDRSVFNRVKHEASQAIAVLEDRHTDSFDKLFMKKVPFHFTFDHILHIDMSSDLDQMVRKLKVESRVADHGGSRLLACRSAILVLMEKALGQRVLLIQACPRVPPEWDVTEPPPPEDEASRLTVGLTLDPEFAFSVLDKGPPADSPEAVEFREFWGSVCELRRFQDGAICEAVLWMQKAPVCDRQLVCANIIKHVLNRHAGIPANCVQYIGGQLNSMLCLPVTMSNEPNTLPFGTGDEQSADLMKAYDDVCKKLRQLTDLPLTINSVQGVSPCFRFTEVFPPLPCTFRHTEERSLEHGMKRYVPTPDKPCPLYTHILKVVCTLEGSGKWPDDLVAMKRLKAAFHLQLGDAIHTTFNLPTRPSVNYVDILKDNYVFRLVLAYTREISLLKSVYSSDGKLMKRDTEEALKLERETIALPRLTSILHGLQQQHPSFSTTVRFAKRWVCGHMLGDHIHPMALELVVASLYLSPAPYTPPRSGLVGFLRFLDFLTTFDWKSSPLLVNLNNEFTDADLSEIPTKFSKERSNLPLMFISTPLDPYSQHWTKEVPSAAVLTRLVLLAAKSLAVLQRDLMQMEKQDLTVVFRPSLAIFNLVIHLNEKQLPRRLECLDVAMESDRVGYGKASDKERFPVTDFDPAQIFLNELKSTFGDVALFFHDQYGGKVIGVVWKPKTEQPKQFKVSHVNHSRPESCEGDQFLLALNIEGVIEDIKLMGRGLVTAIEINHTKTS